MMLNIGEEHARSHLAAKSISFTVGESERRCGCRWSRQRDRATKRPKRDQEAERKTEMDKTIVTRWTRR